MVSSAVIKKNKREGGGAGERWQKIVLEMQIPLRK